MSLSPSIVSAFEIICAIQFTALFVLILADSYSSIKQSLISSVANYTSRNTANILPLKQPVDHPADKRLR
jgi:hypothetical protein